MRKKLVVCVIASICLFVSASPWEGAAATAPEGELPGNGRYVATNSFPRNTVVDILNIETNKSTRVIVANGLDSPGLLAIVSREAAELIGMRQGSVSRIRMTQPSDPVAYVRFMEGLTSGITDYDSGNVAKEEFVNPSVPPSRAVSSDAEETDALAYNADSTAPFTAIPDTGYPSYVLEPEWSGAAKGVKSARNIVDLPDTESEKKSEEPTPPSINDVPESVAEDKPAEEPDVSEKIAEKIPEDEDDDYYEEPEYVAEYLPEDEYYEDDFFEEPEEIAESVDDSDDADDYDYGYYYEEPEEIVAEYNIVPTDDRPPSSIYGIDPALIIPEVKRAGDAETVNTPRIVNEPRVETDFSIPRKYELSRGSYYVQLVAFDTVESVENSISRIDQNYKQKFQPFVYKDSDQWYHVLLGPLNQGESYAVLQRFKSIGYKDAFVKLVR